MKHTSLSKRQIIASNARYTSPLGKRSCGIGDVAMKISSWRLLGEILHQDGEYRVIRPTENMCRRFRKRYKTNSKGSGLI